MRITARLDEESEYHLERIKQLKGLTTFTEVIKLALRHTAQNLETPPKSGSKMKALLESDFIGSGDGPEDLSVNYKEYLYQGLQDKHGSR